MTMYINLINSQYIPDEAVVRETDDGLMYFEGDSWKYLTKGEYKKLDEYEDYIPQNVGKETYASLPIDELVPADSVHTEKYRYYTTYFGLNDLVIGNKKFYETSGVITDDIEVKKGVPLKLKANIKEYGFSSIEFSIIDGTEEHPILPNGETEVKDEKVFFNTETRMIGEDKKFRKDFKPLGKTIDDDDFFNDVILTVSYVPDKKYQTYTPKHDKVKVKIIIRVYKENTITPEISNIVLTQEN